MMQLAMTRIQSFAELGGPVVVLLMAVSVLALAIALWKALVFELEGIGRASSRGFLTRTLASAPKALPEAALREWLFAKLEVQFGQVSQGLRVLDLTAQIAPLLGLFGTVLGMIDAFRTLQEAGSAADPSVLAGGIWVALMTTAAGLVVAIPASVLLSWFDSRLEAHRRRAASAVEDLLAQDTSTEPRHALAA